MTQAMRPPIAALCALVLLSSCADYEFKFNNTTLYTPEPLFADYAIEDPQLKGCVQQTIKDQQVTAAKDLEVLVCTSAGVNSAEGLETFTNLRKLNLAHNLLDNIEPLTQLPALTHLDLTDNAIKDVAPLMDLAHLEWLNLQGNQALVCASVAKLTGNSDVEVEPPEHCEGFNGSR